jgi:hypothetical protein
LPVVVCLSFSGRDIAERFHQRMVIEPGHPFQRCQLDGLACFPGAATNQFSLVQAVDRFSEGVIVAVAPTADRRFDARFGEPLAIANADVLRTSVGVVYQRSAPPGRRA